MRIRIITLLWRTEELLPRPYMRSAHAHYVHSRMRTHRLRDAYECSCVCTRMCGVIMLRVDDRATRSRIYSI